MWGTITRFGTLQSVVVTWLVQSRLFITVTLWCPIRTWWWVIFSVKGRGPVSWQRQVRFSPLVKGCICPLVLPEMTASPMFVSCTALSYLVILLGKLRSWLVARAPLTLSISVWTFPRVSYLGATRAILPNIHLGATSTTKISLAL